MKKVFWSVLALIVLIVGGVVFATWRYPLAIFRSAERRTLVKRHFEKKATIADKGPMTYWEEGQGNPLIFLHGAGDQAGTWSKVAPAFVGNYRVILPDLPGHGESAPMSGALTIGDEVKGVEALVANLKLGKVTIIGNSMGGWVALLYAYKHPENVERIVLVNGGPYRVNTTYDLTPETREDARKVMGALQDPGAPAIPNFVLDDVVRTSHSGAIGRLKQASQEEFVLDGKLGSTSVPVDILWGEADRMMGTAYAKRLESDIPASRLTFMPHCGHIPQRECPVVFTSKLQEVLKLSAPESKSHEAVTAGR